MNPAEFSNIANAEDELWWYQGQREILTTLIDRQLASASIGKVLEAGCGTGHTARLLTDRYGWSITALDLSEVGLGHAASRGLSTLVQGDITRLPFRNGEFDLVISLDVIAHLEAGVESAAYREFARVLRPGGRMILRTAALRSLRSRHSEFIVERQRFTRAEVISGLQTAGFRIRFDSYVNAFLLPIAWFKFRVWEPLLSSPPASGVGRVAGWLNRLLRLPLALEARLIAAGHRFPIGQTVLVLAEQPQRQSS
ncbi:MAG: Methyltransferase type 11 [Bryobacterales bacterium]|nr:Methyltransferase type 11 [Bryobacterales bacterium]